MILLLYCFIGLILAGMEYQRVEGDDWHDRDGAAMVMFVGWPVILLWRLGRWLMEQA